MKNKLLIILVVVIVASTVLVTMVEEADLEPEPGAITFEIIVDAWHGGYSEQISSVIRNEGDWNRLWQEVTATIVPPPSAPEVDFDKYILLAHFMGQRPSGGYAVEFTEVFVEEEKIYVTIQEISPGLECGAVAVITNPYQIIQIPKTEKEIEFIVKEIIKEC